MARQTTLIVLVDALRHDYVNPIDAPFLHEMAGRGFAGTMVETFAFELRPAFFAGLHPEQCGVANMFYYDPANSPFVEVDLAGKTRAEINAAVKEVERRRGNTASAEYGFSAEIPLDQLRKFAFAEEQNTWEPGALGDHPTVFDALRKAGKEWLWLGYPRGDLRTAPLLAEFKRQLRADHAVVYLHFSELDWVGHDHGPDSDERRRTLREIDAALREVYATLYRTFEDVRGVVFGDHGMVAVEHHIDLEAALRAADLRPGEDFDYFLDSTQARFWFTNPDYRSRVQAVLDAQAGGTRLTEADFTRLRARFPDHRFGEEIFVVDDKTIIFPNFFQHENPVLGMHGYLHDVEANWSSCIITGVAAGSPAERPFSMVRLFPTILSLANLEIPAGIEPAPLEIEFEPPAVLDLSVIVPTYDRADVLQRCLDALSLDQGVALDRFEVIVVDDGSSDRTPEVVASFVANTEGMNVVALRQDNSGPATARNLALREARGAIVLFINDDALFPPGCLKAHLDWHREHPAMADAVSGSMRWSPEVEVTPFRIWLEREGPLFAHSGLEDGQLLDYRYFITANLSMKRTFLGRHGYFDEEYRLPMLEDTELGFRLERFGLRITYAAEIVGQHLHHITLEGFCRRQKQVGQHVRQAVAKHPDLEASLVPELGNPCHLLGAGGAEELLAHLATLEKNGELVRRLADDPHGEDAATRVLFRVYTELVGWFRVRGFLEDIESDAGGTSMQGYDAAAWDYLGLDMIPVGHRLAFLQEAKHAPTPPARIDEMQSQIDDLDVDARDTAAQLQDLGRHYQGLEQKHADLIDQYGERQRTVEQLLVELADLRRRSAAGLFADACRRLVTRPSSQQHGA